MTAQPALPPIVIALEDDGRLAWLAPAVTAAGGPAGANPSRGQPRLFREPA